LTKAVLFALQMYGGAVVVYYNGAIDLLDGVSFEFNSANGTDDSVGIVNRAGQVECDGGESCLEVCTACRPHVDDDAFAPKPHVDDDALAPASYVDDDAFAPKPHVDDDALAPKPYVDDDALAPKPYVDDDAFAPKPHVDDDALGPKTPRDSTTKDESWSTAVVAAGLLAILLVTAVGVAVCQKGSRQRRDSEQRRTVEMRMGLSLPLLTRQQSSERSKDMDSGSTELGKLGTLLRASPAPTFVIDSNLRVMSWSSGEWSI
jgi:hypothetical protein